MRGTTAITYRPVEGIGDLFGAGPVVFRVALSGPAPDPATLLFPEFASDEIRRQHHLVGGAGSILLSTMPNALVSRRSVVGTEAVAFLLGDPVPAYVDMYLSDGRCPPDSLSHVGRVRKLPGASVLLTHWNSSIYGHWLMEGVPKLFLLRRLRSDLPGPLRIVVPSTVAAMVRPWSELLMPGVEIEVFDDASESVLCEHLLLPSWLGGRTHHYHSLLGVMIDEFRVEHGIEDAGERIYVSRETENEHRVLTNKAEVEEIAADVGFRIVIPERLTPLEQMQRFGSATRVVGPFGSSMHNAIFSPVGAKVCCLNWINGLQSKISHLRRQSVGYILPVGGLPVAHERGKPPMAGITIDPGLLRHVLEQLVRVA